MSLKLKKWNTAEFITSESDGRALLEEVMREGTAAEIAHAIEAAALARGMGLLAQELGIPRDRLFQLINPWDERFEMPVLQDIAERLVAVGAADAAE